MHFELKRASISGVLACYGRGGAAGWLWRAAGQVAGQLMAGIHTLPDSLSRSTDTSLLRTQAWLVWPDLPQFLQLRTPDTARTIGSDLVFSLYSSVSPVSTKNTDRT